MKYYPLVALLKIIIGASILFFIWKFVNPFEDTAFALTAFSIGIALVSRWVFFFFFYLIQLLLLPHISRLTIASLSRWQALLVMIFILANIAFLILKIWSKPLLIFSLLIILLVEILISYNIYIWSINTDGTKNY